jgi:hypothetical protein
MVVIQVSKYKLFFFVLSSLMIQCSDAGNSKSITQVQTPVYSWFPVPIREQAEQAALGCEKGVPCANVEYGFSDLFRLHYKPLPPIEKMVCIDPYGIKLQSRDRRESLVCMGYPDHPDFVFQTLTIYANAHSDSCYNKLPAIPTECEHFVTSNGFHLGMLMDEVMSCFGQPSVVNKIGDFTTLEYYINDDLFYATYRFDKNQKCIEIIFGDVNP